MSTAFLARRTRLLLALSLASLAAPLSACGGSAAEEEAVGRTSGGPLTAGDESEAPPPREPLGDTRLVEMRSDSPVVTVRVFFDAGSAEDGERGGITRLTARLMAEGGAGDLSYAELTERLFPMAASISTHTGRDGTVFVGQVHRDHLESFYALFRDVLLRPQMGAEDFERIRAQAKSALTLELRSSDEEELGKQTLQSMLYDGHPYEHPALGTERGLEETSVDDVRAHRNRVFCGGRAMVGVAGGYPEGFAERVREDVASLDWETCVGRIRLPEPTAVEAPMAQIVQKDDAGSVAISMGMPIGVTRSHPDYPALALAAAYLGQHRTFAGLLMQKMRGERGLNYGDYAYAEHFVQEGWSRFPLPNTPRRQQYFSIWIRPVRPEQAHFATRMAVRELRRFVETGLTEEDFERIRTFASRYYALYLQTESRRLGFAMDQSSYGVDEGYLEQLRTAWQGLTVEELNAAIRRHVDPNRLRIAMVASDATGLAEALASERPSPIEYPAEVDEAVQAEDREIVGYRIGIPRERIGIVPVAQMFAGEGAAPARASASDARLPSLGIPNEQHPATHLVVGGQPTEESLRAAKEAGVRTVVNLRTDGEPGVAEEVATVEALGLEMVRIPVAGADGLTVENARALHEALESAEGPVLLHCGSGNRAAALLALRAFLEGASIAEAVTLAEEAGITGLEGPLRQKLVALCAETPDRDC